MQRTSVLALNQLPAGVCFEMLVQERFGDLRGGLAVAVGELLAERVGVDDDVDGAEVDGLHSMWSKFVDRTRLGQRRRWQRVRW